MGCGVQRGRDVRERRDWLRVEKKSRGGKGPMEDVNAVGRRTGGPFTAEMQRESEVKKGAKSKARCGTPGDSSVGIALARREC